MACVSLWRLQTLGTLRLIRDGEVDSVRFRYRDSWALLVSLATDPATTRRDALVERFGLDRGSRTGETGRDKLRIRLSDLRTGARGQGGLGADALVTDVDTVRLRPGRVTTDLERIRELLGRASSHPSEAEGHLREAASLLRGGFLEGVDPTGDGWLESMRAEAEGLSARVWLSLAQALRSGPDRRAAFDAARRAFSLRPEDPDALELLLELSDGAREHEEVPRLSGDVKLDDLLARVDRLEAEGTPLNVAEETLLRAAAESRLHALSAAVRDAVLALALLPAPFTAEQAATIAEVGPALFSRVAAAFPWRRDAGRYWLPEALRRMLAARVPSERRAEMARRHARAWVAWLGSESPGTRDSGWGARFTEDEGHLIAAAAWFLDRPPEPAAVRFAYDLFTLSLEGDLSPAARDPVLAARAWFETAAVDCPEEAASYACHLLATQATLEYRFRDALEWLRRVRESPPSVNLLYRLMNATHHAGEDAIFDQLAALRDQTPPPDDDDQARREEREFASLRAENRLARGDCLEALRCNDAAMEAMRRGAGHNPEVLLEQRGRILAFLGRDDEAHAAWDLALTGFVASRNDWGVAICWLATARRVARSGQPGLAESMTRAAMRSFAALEKPASVAVARGRLADLLDTVGRRDEALEEARRGLEFWRAEGNRRWIAEFEARVERLANG